MGKYSNKYDVVSDIYDQYVSIDYDIPFWIEECSKVDTVLELTAGTGRISIPLAKNGINVTALDASKALLNILRQKAKTEGLEIEIVEGDIRAFRLDRKYPLIILPFQSLQELVNRVHQLETLSRVKEHLKENGKFIVSIHNPKYIDNRNNQTPLGEFTDKNTGHLIRFYNNRSVNGHLALNEQVYKEYDGGKLVSERKFPNESYVFEEGELEELLDMVGFRVEHVWGGYKHEPATDNSRFLIYALLKQ